MMNRRLLVSWFKRDFGPKFARQRFRVFRNEMKKKKKFVFASFTFVWRMSGRKRIGWIPVGSSLRSEKKILYCLNELAWRARKSKYQTNKGWEEHKIHFYIFGKFALPNFINSKISWMNCYIHTHENPCGFTKFIPKLVHLEIISCFFLGVFGGNKYLIWRFLYDKMVYDVSSITRHTYTSKHPEKRNREWFCYFFFIVSFLSIHFRFTSMEFFNGNDNKMNCFECFK